MLLLIIAEFADVLQNKTLTVCYCISICMQKSDGQYWVFGKQHTWSKLWQWCVIFFIH